MPDDLSNVESDFERRLRAMQRRLQDASGTVELSRGAKIEFMSPICNLVDSLHTNALQFPVGKAPSRRQCLDQLQKSIGGPAIHFNIDVRRSVRLGCRTLGDPATLHYTASMLDCNIIHGQELVTTRPTDVAEWLLRTVVPMAFEQPSRPRNLHKLQGGPPGMATADDLSPATPPATPPPPPPAVSQLPTRESRRVELD